jgi:hypothetical protein
MYRKLLGFTVCGKFEERHFIHDGVPIHANMVATYRRGPPEPSESIAAARPLRSSQAPQPSQAQRSRGRAPQPL